MPVQGQSSGVGSNIAARKDSRFFTPLKISD